MTRSSLRACWARLLVRDKVNEDLQHQVQVQSRGTEVRSSSPCTKSCRSSLTSLTRRDIEPSEREQHGTHTPLKVCIVGAGISGLYIALLLDSLEEPQLSYELLEASPRVGGRVRTHRFSTAAHDYCDTGAMRFPRIPLMKRCELCPYSSPLMLTELQSLRPIPFIEFTPVRVSYGRAKLSHAI